MKPHSWLNWCISHFVHAKMNKWISEIFPTPLLGKYGSSIQHLWWNGLYCGVHEVNKQSTFCICNISPSILARHSESTRKSSRIWSYLQAHLISYLSSFAHWVQVTYSFFSSNPNFLSLSLKNSEFFASSGHISNVSSSRKMFQNFSHTQYSWISFLSFLSPAFQIKVFKSRNWFYSFGS